MAEEADGAAGGADGARRQKTFVLVVGNSTLFTCADLAKAARALYIKYCLGVVSASPSASESDSDDQVSAARPPPIGAITAEQIRPDRGVPPRIAVGWTELANLLPWPMASASRMDPRADLSEVFGLTPAQVRGIQFFIRDKAAELAQLRGRLDIETAFQIVAFGEAWYSNACQDAAVLDFLVTEKQQLDHGLHEWLCSY